MSKPRTASADDARPRPLRLLHLSDLHFAAGTKWDSDTVLGRLVKDVVKLRQQSRGIDLVVVTGDVASTGKASEYDAAWSWLSGPLAQAAGVGVERIRVVPGNHDVDRDEIDFVAESIEERIRAKKSQDVLGQVLDQPKHRAPPLARQSAWLDFARRFHPDLQVPWWSEVLDLRGNKVHLAGFNSAWLSSSDADRGNLILSRWMCNQLLEGADDADLSVALLHHAWDALAEWDKAVSEEAIRRRCGLILRGHLHEQAARLSSDPDRHVLELAAGACYAGSRWPNSYQLLELDASRGEARIHLRTWDGHDWIPDQNRYQSSTDGAFTLPLRRSPRAPSEASPPPPREKPPATALKHYRAALRRRVEDMPWLSRQLGLTKTLSEVCVRVEVCERDAAAILQADPERFRSAEHLPLLDVIGPTGARWVMLGEPGSGKSTLLRRLALDLEAGGVWLPVLLHASDLRERELLDAVRHVWGKGAAEGIAAWPPERLAVLVDGLDEAGSPREVGRILQARADDLGEATLIVAGRPEGQLDPWPGFGALQILPLAEGEQDRLLEGLGVSAEVAGPALVRLRADRRLNEIAARPLLLTLAALVLKRDGALPDKRVRLYERALDCMLHRAELNPQAPHEPVRAPESVEAALVYLAPRLLSRGEGPWSRASVLSYLRGNNNLMRDLWETWRESTAEAFLDETGRTVGILVPQGRGFGFPHRSLGEYLASRGLVEDAGAREVALQSGLKNPAAWAEVLALTVGQLGATDADALIQRIVAAGEVGRPLLHRVLADAEGLSAQTSQNVLGLERGWRSWEERKKVYQQLPALVGDGAVAARLLDRLRRLTTDGNDLYWIRETLRAIAAEPGAAPETIRIATDAAGRIFDHLPAANLERVTERMEPLWSVIPKGSFKMGGTEYRDEQPVHDVHLSSDFMMLNILVTWELYRLFDPGHDAARTDFVDAQRSRRAFYEEKAKTDRFYETIRRQIPFDQDEPCAVEAQDQHPVHSVTWYAATMFAAWVGARLPLEPEWEYACRAGTTTRYAGGDTEADLARVGWYTDNSRGHTHPVALKPANAWGLHDMHGNVWEWCQDWYQEDVYVARAQGVTVNSAHATYTVGKKPPESAEAAARGDNRVLRGGSWSSRPDNARSANRGRDTPSGSYGNFGFRLVLPSAAGPVAVPERA